MTHISFIACSKTKADHSAPAAALYTSPLFRKSLLAGLDTSDNVFIVSAKHGVLPLGTIISPYDVTIKKMSTGDRRTWAAITALQIERVVKRGDLVSLYCGKEYISPLRETLARIGCRVEEPLRGLSLGKRLKYLRNLNDEGNLQQLLKAYYKIMRRLWVAQGGGRKIADCTGRLSWPTRGVYFVAAADENAPIGRSMPRIVRVGTHAVSAGSRTTLWDRISTHRGTKLGSGSHRSSIFRLHVGRAVVKRYPDKNWPATWSKGQTASVAVRTGEAALEQEVSRAIGEMRILWIDVADDASPGSDRAYLERNAIGLLSRAGFLTSKASDTWLGRISDDWRISGTGLWNLDHVFLRPDPRFLDVLSRYVDVTLGRAPVPRQSLAPTGWRLRPPKSNDTQLNLFAD